MLLVKMITQRKLFSLVFLMLVTSSVRAEPSAVYHTVVFWLKTDTPTTAVNEIVRSVKGLEDLDMVDQVFVGKPIPSDREVVDDSFSLAFTMTFKDEAALLAYNKDPQHKKSSENTLKYVLRGVIYDYKLETDSDD